MKKILFALFLFSSFSMSAQTVKKLDDGTLVEVNTYETPITLSSIDARIKGFEQMIELHKKELDKLYAIRKEVEAMEGMKAKSIKKGKKK